MSCGLGLGDFIAISKLAITVYTAYKDAPKDYQNIAEEVKSLQIMINKAAQHTKSTALSHNDLQEGQEVLRGCQSILEDLNSLIEKWNSLSSATTSQVFKRVKLGTEDITTLRARLISNTGLLSSFIRSCEFLEMQAQLNNLIDLHRSTSRSSITSFVGSTATKEAFKQLCQNLYQMGVRAKMIKEKESEIVRIFKLQNTTISGHIDDSNIADQLPGNQSRIRPPTDHLAGSPVNAAKNPKRLISALKYIRTINFWDDQKETALHKAAGRGQKDIVQQLLRRGASTQAVNKYNNTPLHLAARSGHTSTVEVLLKKDAFTGAVNIDNDTPLHLATRNGHISTMELLLGKGALIEAIGEYNNTPLHLAAQDGHAMAVELLISKGASIEALNRFNNTPLHLAGQNGHAGTTELLLEAGSSIEAVNWLNDTPLSLAVRNGNFSIVELIFRKGAPVDSTDKDGNTLLHIATFTGHTSMVGQLLKKGASTEARNGENNTPLHLATWYGHTGTVEQLLRNGASVGATNRYNRTPLDYAVLSEYTDIVQLLENKAAEHVACGNHG